MERWWWPAGFLLASFAASCLGTRLLIPLLRRGAVLDRPNERSSHVRPTPRGGGIAVVGTMLLAWAAASSLGRVPGSIGIVPVAASLLAVVCWIDDLRSLPASVRLIAQGAAVAVGATALPSGVFQGWLGDRLDTIAAALLWLWFVNLFNFMDGIDGIAGSEAAAIGLGLVLVGLSTGTDVGTAILGASALGASALGASAGFLVWNWAPARIFLGDVGSVPLGYLLGFLLLDLAAHGHWEAALILPLYFLADATITLARRILRGERFWRAHREHFYQRAAARGLGHAAIVRRVIAADLALIACAIWTEHGGGATALAAALAVVGGLMAWLWRARGAA